MSVDLVNGESSSGKNRVKIKVAFLSRYLVVDHSLGMHIRGIIDYLPRDKFEVLMIHIKPVEERGDESTNFIRGQDGDDDPIFLSSEIDELGNNQRILEAQGIDVLIYPEIGMDAHTYFLSFAR